MKAYILLYRGHNFIDTLIRWQTWGSVAHAAVWIDGLLYEAVASGVIRRAVFDPFAEGAEVYSITGMTNAGIQAMEIFLRMQVGKSYDFRGLFQFLARDGSNNPLRWFCSDLAFWAVNRGGVQLLARVPRCKVSPEGLRRSPLLVGPLSNS